ncbi:retinol dehydrogenase 13-like isoform X2 [Macrobrachium nipponense]|uniref:retinol dehydrogenase 13-like isoform X2 n=1 Tax=Macrobrachium nipponense TaxID=159736 RepID=UPI0030C87580
MGGRRSQAATGPKRQWEGKGKIKLIQGGAAAAEREPSLVIPLPVSVTYSSTLVRLRRRPTPDSLDCSTARLIDSTGPVALTSILGRLRVMMCLHILASFLAIAISGGIVYRRRSGRCTSKKLLHNETVIITGASAGIGKATAHDLARRGARVIMACRNLIKAQRVADIIKSETGNPQVIVEELDLSDLESVRRFAENIKKKEKSLKVLINNAGAGVSTRQMSPQNLELTMATNHYGHFLLTNLLLDLLKASAPSRIVTVSSKLHGVAKEMDVDNLNFTNAKEYSLLAAYAQSKLCNILFTKELSRRLEGTGVTANCLHPGVVATEGFHKVGTLRGYIYSALAQVVGKDCLTGAQTTIYLAVSDEVKDSSGKYFVDCQESTCYQQAENEDLARRLWDVSERDVSLEAREKFC